MPCIFYRCAMVLVLAACQAAMASQAQGNDYLCVTGQGKSHATANAYSSDNSELACGAVCSADSQCVGFDYTTDSQGDSCRTYHVNEPRTEAGINNRQWCARYWGSTACPDGICPGLGHVFYLPTPNVISTGGRVFVLNTRLGQCASAMAASGATRAVKTANSMQELVRDTNTEVGLSGSYKTATLSAKGSVDVLTSTRSDLTTSFHATSLDVTTIKQEIYLEQSSECFGQESNFSPTFLGKFEALQEIDPTRVGESSSWAPYVNFLKDQGSHIMIRQSIGSRFQQWESSTSSSSNTAKTLATKACANVEGVSGAGGWSVAGCAAYNESEKKTALKTESNTHMVVTGGTTATRTAIINDLNADTLSAFIASAPSGDLPVSYGFKPLWETLITFFNTRCSNNGPNSEDCKHRQRAYNLQAAYEGWIATSCPTLTTSNNRVYQTMSISYTTYATIKTYQCDAAKTGCYSNDDCHLGGAGSVCFCYGPSCIDNGDMVSGTSMQRSKVRGDQSGSNSDGVNNACYYKFLAHCNCDASWSGGLKARQLYVQGQTTLTNLGSAPSPTLV